MRYLRHRRQKDHRGSVRKPCARPTVFAISPEAHTEGQSRVERCEYADEQSGFLDSTHRPSSYQKRIFHAWVERPATREHLGTRREKPPACVNERPAPTPPPPPRYRWNTPREAVIHCRVEAVPRCEGPVPPLRTRHRLLLRRQFQYRLAARPVTSISSSMALPVGSRSEPRHTLDSINHGMAMKHCENLNFQSRNTMVAHSPLLVWVTCLHESYTAE